jgi:phenylalanyl-tRNA synthetase alpha chain
MLYGAASKHLLSSLRLFGKEYPTSAITNIGPGLLSKLDKKLHQQWNHPLGILRSKIEASFNRRYMTADGKPLFTSFTSLCPVVTVQQNFDDLLIPLDHPGRQPTDTYYINDQYLLRTHTTAHEVELIRKGYTAFLTSGDVYRRDEIDTSHYPVFHQMEGVRLFPAREVSQTHMDYGTTSQHSNRFEWIEHDMKCSRHIWSSRLSVGR